MEHKKDSEENPKEQEDPDEEEDLEESINSNEADPFASQKEEKLQLRLELEFEKIDDDRQGVLDVEEIKKQENKLLATYIQKADSGLTSAHLKAGRKILNGFRNWKTKLAEKEKL